MCVIAIKCKGVKMPDESTLKTMWTNNPHGAGLMYARDGRVYIEKGYMDWTSFFERVKTLGDVTDEAVIMHFRIATHGSVIPGNTHPFPVSRDVIALTKLRGSCKVGVAHNGIIPIEPRAGISDTMEYIATRLAPRAEEDPDWYKSEDVLMEIGREIKSKLAVLDGDGFISYYGNFITEKDGMIYSNDSYLPRVYTRYIYRDASPLWYGEDFDEFDDYKDSGAPWDTGNPSVMLCPLSDVKVKWQYRDKRLARIDKENLWVDRVGHAYVIDYDYAVAYEVVTKMLTAIKSKRDLFKVRDGVEFELAGSISVKNYLKEVSA